MLVNFFPRSLNELAVVHLKLLSWFRSNKTVFGIDPVAKKMLIFYPWVKSRTKPGILVMLNILIKIALLNGMECGLADRQLLKDFGVISSVDAKCSCRSLSIMSATNVWSEPSNSSRVTVLGQSLG